MILITVTQTQGSVPRDAGTWMVVTPVGIIGTLGGGNVEFQAIFIARGLLRSTSSFASTSYGGVDESAGAMTKRFALGPSLGQCCGGVMDLSFQRIDQLELDALLGKIQANFKPVCLFGGGHVGRAITALLASLPYRVTWIDSRDEIFPADTDRRIICEHSDPVQSAVTDLVSGSHVFIMSFSHAEDLEIVQQCLLRQREKNDMPFIGLIGSKTKWATFQNRLRERGFSDAELAHITCPIGVAGIAGKEPEVIAVAVAAQLLIASSF